MKTILRLLITVVLFAPAALGYAQTATGNLYIHLKDGGLDVIPDSLVKSRAETGGELRISNYLLWQIAYSELYFCDTYWPDFNEESLHKAIESFQTRQRRYGKTEAQVEAEEESK